MALAALLLLLWCHGLDFAFMDHGARLPSVAPADTVAALAAPAPSPPGEPVVVCCPGGAAGDLFLATVPQPPQTALPALAATLSALLFLAAFRPVRPLPQCRRPHRDSLVAKSVLIRI